MIRPCRLEILVPKLAAVEEALEALEATIEEEGLEEEALESIEILLGGAAEDDASEGVEHTKGQTIEERLGSPLESEENVLEVDEVRGEAPDVMEFDDSKGTLVDEAVTVMSTSDDASSSPPVRFSFSYCCSLTSPLTIKCKEN
eukprot:Seg1652.6 transcript_id=Seg1652.6/GoldUCD/mRNA.D3Y31 product="hypothetical protein" protein_id=Seg1652.6/GoldUCD/D3Y31